MTRITRENDADVEDDELQFYLDLGDGLPLLSTVDTFDTYLFKIHDDIESPGRTGDHALSRSPNSPQKPEPSRLGLFHLIQANLEKIQSNPGAMAAQAMEALNRTFVELKSKNEETRLRASYDLRDLVVSAARGNVFTAPCPLRMT